MVVIKRDLKREEIVGFVGHRKWVYHNKENNDILLLIDEKQTNNNGEIINIIYDRENFGRLCIDVPVEGQKFFEKYKTCNPRIFLKKATSNLFDEYTVDSWGADEKGLYIRFE